MKQDKNILKFEGIGCKNAGISECSDLNNSRIRTAFGADNRFYYIECGLKGFYRPCISNLIVVTDFLDITRVIDRFCGYRSLPGEHIEIPAKKAALLDFINQNTGTCFTDIETVNDGTFHVFPDTISEGIDFRRVFRLGNTNEIYIAEPLIQTCCKN